MSNYTVFNFNEVRFGERPDREKSLLKEYHFSVVSEAAINVLRINEFYRRRKFVET